MSKLLQPPKIRVAARGRLTVGWLQWFLFQLLPYRLRVLPATTVGLAQLFVQHLLRCCKCVYLKTDSLNNQALMSNQFVNWGPLFWY